MSYDGPHYRTGSCASNHDCRRPECRTANRRHKKARRVAREGGLLQRVDAARAREHLQALAEEGIGLRLLVQLSGMAPTELCHIRNGRRTVILRHTETRLLALTLDHPRAMVDGMVPRRQITAMYALGYPLDWIRRSSGWWFKQVPEEGQRVRQRQAHAVAELAARVGDTPGPSGTVRTLAARRGWLAPAWYDEDWQPAPGLQTMLAIRDDPQNRGRTGRGLPQRPPEIRAAQAALACTLYRQNHTLREISAALRREFGPLGSTDRAVSRYVERAGLTRRENRATG